jgi:hypothetical protein
VIEVDQDVFDVLMESAVKYALMVSDGSVPRVQGALRDGARDLSEKARREIAHHIIEVGPAFERDQKSWAETLGALEPRRRKS